MRYSPAPIPFALLLLALLLLTTFVQVGALTLALGKLGLAPESALLLLLTSLMGSFINLPLFRMRAEGPGTPPPPWLRGLLRLPPIPFTGVTTVAINVGGALIPAGFSLFLIAHSAPGWGQHLLVIAAVSGVSYALSRPVAGVGIGMPVFVAPITAALMALWVDPVNSAPLAYSGGTLGVLIGADLLRLKDIRRMGTPIASIGGAGTFDGIFLAGIVAVLLA